MLHVDQSRMLEWSKDELSTILKFVFLISNFIKLVPTNPAPPVITILFFETIWKTNIYKCLINQSNLGLYEELLFTNAFKNPDALQ